MAGKSPQDTPKFAETTASATPEDLAKSVSDSHRQTMQSLNWFGTAWLEIWNEMGREVTEFVAERIREDVKTQHALLNCKNVAEMQAIQSQFVQKAIDQYSAETGKLVSLQQELLDRLSPPKSN